MKNADKPAYPLCSNHTEGEGMSKREVFSMAAMQGLLSNAPFIQALGYYNVDHKHLASISIGIADELLKQLES